MKNTNSLFFILLTGCASSSGVVSTGQDTYMVVGTAGNFGSHSADAVSVELYKEATAYCTERKKKFVRVNIAGRDGNFGRNASSKLEFKCVEN